MSDPALAAWLRSFDDVFGHSWESVAQALDGVTEDVADWQSPAYAEEEREAGWPAPGTIAWHVAHLAFCKRHYTRILRARAAVPDVEPREPLSTFADELDALRRAHAEQREAIEGLEPADLDRVVGHQREMSIAEFLAMMIRHDAWHAGQIAVVRRLHRTRI